jgi:hypothetical protein
VFADDADRTRLDVGDDLRLAGVHDAVVSGSEQLSADIDGGEPIALLLQLTDHERLILAAGGLLRHISGVA